MCRFCLNHPPPHKNQLHDAGDPGVALFKNVTRKARWEHRSTDLLYC
jgi:hypothetical protein